MSHPQNGVSRLPQLSGKHTVAPSRPIFEKPLKIRCFRMVFNKVLQRTRKSSFRGVVLTESTLLELLVTTLYPKTRVWPLILVLEAAIRRDTDSFSTIVRRVHKRGITLPGATVPIKSITNKSDHDTRLLFRHLG